MEQVNRFVGKLTWLSGNILEGNPGYQPSSAKILRGIKGKKDFKIEYGKNQEDDGGLIKLVTNNGFDFVGDLYYGNDNFSSANFKLKFFYNENKALLFGLWFQDTETFTVIFELDKVEAFS